MPGTNYTALFSVSSGSLVVDTVAVLSGALTPDTNAPTFRAVGPMRGPVLGSQSFTAAVPLTVDKPSTVSYAVYW